MECNLCGENVFLPYNTRQNAVCKGCGSLERTRAMFHLIQERELIHSRARVAHFAPEISLTRKIKPIVGDDRYEAYDMFPEIYPAEIETKKFDLIKDVESLPSRHYDLILHAHVLEHLPCWLPFVLFHLQRALTDDGYHLFCVPVVEGHSSMDLNSLSDKDRIKRFYQKDHVRNFGFEDTKDNFGGLFNLNSKNHNIQVDRGFAEKHNFKVGEVYTSFFLFHRNDWKLIL